MKSPISGTQAPSALRAELPDGRNDCAYQALRDGAVDFGGGSAHSALAAFPQWDGVKLLCAHAQGMYWFLVMHRDFRAGRGELDVVKGRRIGAAVHSASDVARHSA